MAMEKAVNLPPSGPLQGIRVLDASRVLAGPMAAQILGDLGAEVLKIERPGQGDETRTWGPPFLGDLSAYYLSCNRNKRGVTLNLAAKEGVQLFHELARHSDVILENFLPASAAKLGLTPDELHAVNPKLIICSISGFGRTGPWSEVPGYDFAIQALSGFMNITGPVEGPPSKVGVAIADVVTGLYAVIGVLACLQARHASGHGYAIDLSLLDCAVAAQVNVVQAYLTSGKVPERQGNAHLQIVPYQLFATADGHLVLAVGNDGQWLRFCKAASRPELATDARFRTNPDRVRHRTELITLLEPILKAQSTATWERLLTEAEVPHGAVLNYQQLFDLPQAAARGLRVTVRDHQSQPVDLVDSPLRLSGWPTATPLMPPRPGEHTDTVLGDLCKLTKDDLARLRTLGII